MKKFQMGTLALVAVLAIGGGSVFAAENKEIKLVVDDTVAEETVFNPPSVTVDGIEIASEDEALLKAVENKEVKISVE